MDYPRSVNTLLMVGAIVLVGYGVDRTIAQFQPLAEDWYALVSRSSGKVLDVRSDGTSEIWTFQYLPSQLFQFQPLPSNSSSVVASIPYKIVSHDRDMVLTRMVDGHVGLSPFSEQSVSSQTWTVDEKERNIVSISSGTSRMCMDVYGNRKHEGNKITLYVCGNGKYNQQWALLRLC